MQPEIHIGDVTLQTFGICFALAFLVAAGVLGRYLTEIGKPADWAYEVIFAGLVGGIVGEVKHLTTKRGEAMAFLRQVLADGPRDEVLKHLTASAAAQKGAQAPKEQQA